MMFLPLVLALMFGFVVDASDKVNITGLEKKRELSEDESRIDDIMHALQGICIHEKNDQTVKQLKKDTPTILNNIGIYRDVVKMNKQLRNEIKWIVEESKGPKEVSRIINLLKREVRGVCKPEGKDCVELQKRNMKSGVYTVHPDKSINVKVYCDMDNGGGGWTVFQRRINGKVDFQRDWASYKNGFGNLEDEFWLGNEKIHKLTKNGQYELRIDLENLKGQKAYASYTSFSIGDVSTKYKLTVNGFSGSAGIGDSLKYHNGSPFTTKDQDNDSYKLKCASQVRSGGYWYKACAHSAPNGQYGRKNQYGIYWEYWKNTDPYDIKSVSMKFRKRG